MSSVKSLTRAVFDLGRFGAHIFKHRRFAHPHSPSISGTIKLNISRLLLQPALSETRVGDGTSSSWAIESCLHEGEEELRLGEMVLKSADSSINPNAAEALTATINVPLPNSWRLLASLLPFLTYLQKMINAAATAGHRLTDLHPSSDGDGIPTVAAATAVYRQV